MKAGRWRIAVEAQGFKTTTVDEYKVAVQVTHSLDVKLDVGAIADVVTVTGDQTPAIQTDTSVRQTNVTERQVKELPLEVSSEFSGRTPLSFIELEHGRIWEPLPRKNLGENFRTRFTTGSMDIGQYLPPNPNP